MGILEDMRQEVPVDESVPRDMVVIDSERKTVIVNPNPDFTSEELESVLEDLLAILNEVLAEGSTPPTMYLLYVEGQFHLIEESATS